MPPAKPHPFLKKLGARVRLLRERKGLSQEALADAADVDRSYMSGIERGLRNVSVLNLAKVAKALGVPITSLFDLE
ncbi:MAG: helix-turn-helix transcriptional regulator [Vicinamibacterales bacterium]